MECFIYLHIFIFCTRSHCQGRSVVVMDESKSFGAPGLCLVTAFVHYYKGSVFNICLILFGFDLVSVLLHLLLLFCCCIHLWACIQNKHAILESISVIYSQVGFVVYYWMLTVLTRGEHKLMSHKLITHEMLLSPFTHLAYMQ